MNLKDSIKNYMAENKLNQKQLAKLLDVDHTQISRWLNGRTGFSKAWTSLIKSKLKI